MCEERIRSFGSMKLNTGLAPYPLTYSVKTLEGTHEISYEWSDLIDALASIFLKTPAQKKLVLFYKNTYDDRGRKIVILRCRKPEEKTYQYSAEETAHRLHMTDMTFVKVSGKTAEIQD